MLAMNIKQPGLGHVNQAPDRDLLNQCKLNPAAPLAATSVFDHALGRFWLGASEQGLMQLCCRELPPPAAGISEAASLAAKCHIDAAIRQLEEYLDGRRQGFSLTLAPKGTEFQQAVWRALLAIPFGHTQSYSGIANSIARPKAVRAVGAANGANPIAVVVPCHRVIGKGGALTGYAWGLEMKAALLALEKTS